MSCNPNVLGLLSSFMKGVRFLKVFNYTNSLLKGNIFH